MKVVIGLIGIIAIAIVWLYAQIPPHSQTTKPASAPAEKRTPLDTADVQRTAVFIPAVQAAIKGRLKDPYSAKFEHWASSFRDTPAGRDNAACGMVNAKTGFGGYGGPKLYAYVMMADGTEFHCAEEEVATNPGACLAVLDMPLVEECTAKMRTLPGH